MKRTHYHLGTLLALIAVACALIAARTASPTPRATTIRAQSQRADDTARPTAPLTPSKGDDKAGLTPSDKPKDKQSSPAVEEVSKAAPTEQGGPASQDEPFDQYEPGETGTNEQDGLDESQFVIPQGAEFEPQTALVEVSEGADLDQLASDLQDDLGPVTIRHVTDTYARIEYQGDASVEQVVNELLMSGYAETAQPNYVYHVLGDDIEPTGEQPCENEPSVEVLADPEAASRVEEAPKPMATLEPVPAADVDSLELAESSDAPDADAIELVGKEEDIVVDLSDGTVGHGTIEGQSGDDSIVVLPNDESQISLDAQTSTNDPYASSQWALDSINVYDAWNYAKGNHGVTVAALDLGFDIGHVDLAANIKDPYNAYNAVHGGSITNVSPQDPSFDHGTHVAGIIGAVAGNGKGIAGITHNAYVMPIKVVNANGIATTQEIIKGYDYVLSKREAYNVRVINLSIGADVRKLSGSGMSLSKDDAVIKKVKQAYASGVVTVAAAGNKSASLDKMVPFSCYPSDDDSLVSVMNLKQEGNGVTISPNSNYNATNQKVKDVSAPGTYIYSTVNSSDYEVLSGTSMAAPVVSSVLALEFVANPKLTCDEAVKILYATATNLGGSTWTRQYGWGKVNAAAAVKAAKVGLTAAQTAKAKLTASYLPGGASSSSSPTISYRTHVQRVGWQAWKKNGGVAGTTGKSLRLEGIQIRLSDAPYAGSIQYRTHVQTYGWETTWKAAGKTSGTSGQSKRLEAIKMRLTGNMAKQYDVYYRVHAQHLGWMGWAKNGASAGTAGHSYRLEAIQIRLVRKGGAAPGSTANAFRNKG